LSTSGGATTISGASIGSLNVTSTTLSLGATTISGGLTVSSDGDVSQTGPISVAGASAFTLVGANRNIALASAANDFQGALSFAGSPQDIAVRNTNASAAAPTLPAGLGNLNLQYDNAAIALPAFTLSGSLNLLAGGSVTQSGAWFVAQTSAINAGSNAITLTQANGFGGAVSLTGGATQ
ncbi:MAG: hypothetical protein IV107_20635, partial [Paucibacter sp.]|nr:hypothetical protein [Roseateles sp.]